MLKEDPTNLSLLPPPHPLYLLPLPLPLPRPLCLSHVTTLLETSPLALQLQLYSIWILSLLRLMIGVLASPKTIKFEPL